MSLGWDLRGAVEKSDLPPIPRHLLLTLIFRCDWDTGVIPDKYLPSLTELASITGYSRSTVIEWMPRLQTGGWVKITPPPAGSRDGCNRYQLLIGAPSIPKPVRASRRTRAARPAGELPDDTAASPPSPRSGPPGGPDRHADHHDAENLSGFGRPPGGPDRQADHSDEGALSTFGGPHGGPDRQADPVSGPPGGPAVDRPAVSSRPPGGPSPIKNSPTESSSPTVRPPRPRRTKPTADSATGSGSSRGTRLRADFWPTDEMIDWAREQTPQIGPTATDAFIDYWTSQVGAKGVREDWDAMWRNWMRTEQTRRENALGFTGRRVQTAVDAIPAPRPAADELCHRHQGQLTKSCGPCHGEALATPTTVADAIPRTSAAMCPEHPDFPTAYCRPCRAKRRTTEDPRRQP